MSPEAWTTHAHHITLSFKPLSEGLGRPYVVQLGDILSDGNVIAVEAVLPDGLMKDTKDGGPPHITIATAPGIKPAASNALMGDPGAKRWRLGGSVRTLLLDAKSAPQITPNTSLTLYKEASDALLGQVSEKMGRAAPPFPPSKWPGWADDWAGANLKGRRDPSDSSQGP
jgi:hypothetical protein